MAQHRCPSRWRRQRGMTLMEILISIFLISMMGLVTSGIILNAHNSKELLVSINDRYHGVRVVLDRMSREIATSFITPQVTSGDLSRQVATLFKGEEESPIHKLTFTTFSHIRVVRNSKESDQAVISYYGKPNRKKSGVYRLFRREKVRLDAEPTKGGSSSELLDNVVKLEFRYWDRRKRDWVREWDNTKIERRNQIPPLIEIRLTIRDVGGRDTLIMTRTKLFMDEVVRR